jgi:phosphoenolpyruvate carboxykinase (ATP)
MPLHPTVYAEMLAKKLEEHDVQAWLLNTGWTGGPYGVGSRISIQYSRALVRAAISGELDDVEYITDPIFGLEVPTHCHGVPPELLQPRATWRSVDDYDAMAADVARMFVDNFAAYESQASSEVVAAGPPGAAAHTDRIAEGVAAGGAQHDA